MASPVTAADHVGAVPVVSISNPDAGDKVTAMIVRSTTAALLAEANDIRNNATTGLANKLNRNGDTSTGVQVFAAGATVSSGQALILDGVSVQGVVGFSSLGEVLLYGRKAWFRGRGSLSDANHDVTVDSGDRFDLVVGPAAPRTITLKHTTVVPDFGETLTFFWFPKTTAVGSGTQYTFQREGGTVVATFDGAVSLQNHLVWAEFEYTSSGWRLGENSGALYDAAGAAYYGVIGGAGA